jgi:glycosyltransferase involved in cell wall biosynthesis
MRAVLTQVQRVLADDWRMQFLTRHKGVGAEAFAVATFGRLAPSPWHTPGAWLYALAGWRKTRALLRRGAGYEVILPQDGVFTGAFAALAAHHAGVRVVVMDHGNVTWLRDRTLRAERLGLLAPRSPLRRLWGRLLLLGYWPTLRLLARITVRYADAFLVAGDEVEEAYRCELGVHPSRIVRYPYVVDCTRFVPALEAERARLREEAGLAGNALVVTLINRLEPEKGLDVAVEGIHDALAALPSDTRSRVHVLIAGGGLLRGQVERDLRAHGLADCCTLLGEAGAEDVVKLLRISDVFLYAGTRGTNYSMAVLEAMACGCAVVATTQPRSNATLLADGRGLAIPPGDARAIAEALRKLLADAADAPLARAMGERARDYVLARHSDAELRRCLLLATCDPHAARAVGMPAATVEAEAVSGPRRSDD